ncbi:cAMP-binding domain of CRP or a regulatory subunit of cAMP-dependent protein kinases [Rhizobium sp. RU35A]|uniref:Crp/Fnr family transcriptional regulator n=1 Tax=Rhizobium straminoryzae TaxID=1387186 RepID=A0A549SZB8_9HYPH|nr:MULTISPECIES: Crp/Fnr family transcriptional regulator [Rhizobium]TRL34959.1 Crp/Fnr family transcriptional regulator [Rhizobium straminoryzae]SIQ12951.1 cAMP-binding domain of CRP or a regulatory subunit of cAMP-dependent protein kinases [Rhizobium sp. RU35A]
MTQARPLTPPRVPCDLCPLRRREGFRDFTGEELSFVSSFKFGELAADPGATIISEGERHPQLYTVLAGWGFRYKILEDGRRQILNYVLPGDLVGLQGNLMTEMLHSVESLTRMTLCIFERDRLTTLFRHHPSLAYDLTWIASREESMLDEHLLSIGRRTALERAAYLLAFLDHRARVTGAFGEEGPFILPLTQQHVADTLGLSLVHTNKTLRKLSDAGVLRWLDRGSEVLERARLLEIAGWQPTKEGQRPFI